MNTRIKENVQRLFEFWCELIPEVNGEKVSGHIISKFPKQISENDSKCLAEIPDFVFPCIFRNELPQIYSFVLTNYDSKFRFGFCHHDPVTNKAMVIVTYLPWHDTFRKFLIVLSQLKLKDDGEFIPFLMEAYKKGVPDPGSSLKLSYNSGLNHFMFQSPAQFQLPSIPENFNLNTYYNFVDAKNMIGIFAAMLAERRIIFESSHLEKLSSCVQAASAFLYPMMWQHIFIPILPMKLKDSLGAPMPFLIGVPEAVLKTMTKEEIGECVIFNCDKKTLQTPFDDTKNMPTELVSQLKKQLNNQDLLGDRISKIFLGVLVQLIGGYRDAIKFTQGEKITWDQDAFIESRSTSVRPYLREIMQSQIFQQFIEEKLEMLNTGKGYSDEFEIETVKHFEKMGRKGQHYKEFLKNMKHRTNPAVKSAVQSVKQGSRGVKTAYKDLKTKFRQPNTSGSSGASEFHTVDFGTGKESSKHHSAPNSPVFTKQTPSDLLYLSKPHSMLQSSNSLMNNSNFTNNNSNVHNTHINRKNSPVSQSSSNSSSEMNLFEELQQHRLFKMSNCTHRIPLQQNSATLEPLHGGSLASTPNHRTNNQAPDAMSLRTLCMFDDEELPFDEILQHKPIPSEDECSFDSPPEMPSPPVPPRGTMSLPSPPQSSMNKHNNTSDTTRSKQLQKSHTTAADLLLSTSSSSSPMFENNFVNNDIFSSVITPDPFNVAEPLIPIRHRKPSNNTTMNSIKTTTTKSPSASAVASSSHNTSHNLINLETNTSFELEDFDPLNQNAKQLPSTQLKNASKNISPINSSLYPNSYNPVYSSYLASPMHSATHHVSNTNKPFATGVGSGDGGSGVGAAAMTKKKQEDEDVELLKKYGLDKFSLVDSGDNKGSNALVRNSCDRNNWTVFE